MWRAQRAWVKCGRFEYVNAAYRQRYVISAWCRVPQWKYWRVFVKKSESNDMGLSAFHRVSLGPDPDSRIRSLGRIGITNEKAEKMDYVKDDGEIEDGVEERRERTGPRRRYSYTPKTGNNAQFERGGTILAAGCSTVPTCSGLTRHPTIAKTQPAHCHRVLQ